MNRDVEGTVEIYSASNDRREAHWRGGKRNRILRGFSTTVADLVRDYG